MTAMTVNNECTFADGSKLELRGVHIYSLPPEVQHHISKRAEKIVIYPTSSKTTLVVTDGTSEIPAAIYLSSNGFTIHIEADFYIPDGDGYKFMSHNSSLHVTLQDDINMLLKVTLCSLAKLAWEKYVKENMNEMDKLP